MKKSSLFIALALMLLSTAFTPVAKKQSVSPNQPSKAGVSFHTQETIVIEETFVTCDFDAIHVPNFTITVDFHGVINGRMTLIQGSMNFSGRGTSTITGETYDLNYTEKMVAKTPFVNGATVFIHKRHYDFTGDQGSVMNIINNVRFVINPKGEIVSDDERTEIVCL